jgi:hypothetical protein
MGEDAPLQTVKLEAEVKEIEKHVHTKQAVSLRREAEAPAVEDGLG